ncbi:hypothetical protein [Photobacterium leiognathi]|uniref:hypothetical protein n=1 Tax=Photobacterium leiognathi TaxID=553611 RepID=UPI0029827925|nr:hypothetical protein [Photobacterium leiognathi]
MRPDLRIGTLQDLKKWVKNVAEESNTNVQEHKIQLVHGEFSDGSIGYMVQLTHTSQSVEEMLITDGLATQIMKKKEARQVH